MHGQSHIKYDRKFEERILEVKEWTEIPVECTEYITSFAELSIPVLRYSFGIINWSLGEIKDRQ
jgi:hypothetical protein